MALKRRIGKGKVNPATSLDSVEGLLNDIMPDINKGTVIPIISNSFRIEQIFRDEKELLDELAEVPEYDDEDLTIDEQLTKEWSDDIEYPMTDDHNLARVAQYYQVEQKETLLPKLKYRNFLNKYLLDVTKDDEPYAEVARQLTLQSQERLFSDIAEQLDYPRLPDGKPDPLRLLAKLPLKIFVTTSYYDFLERALLKENKEPRVQVCFWEGGKLNADPSHHPADPEEYNPSATNPAVYHLFGLENYLNTLVLSEDDYMNFLVAVARDTDNLNPVVPLQLRGALAQSRLLLLGYHLKDWDFRVLFKFISNYRHSKSVPRGIVIQLKPPRINIENEKNAIRYLEQYFENNQFSIDWTSAERFVFGLWETWNKYRQGQL